MNVIKSYNPATKSLIGETEVIPPENLDSYLDNASIAQSKWKKTSVKERIRSFKKLLRHVSEHMESIGQIIHEETGKPRIEAINSDILAGMASLRYTIKVLRSILKPKKIKFKGMRLPLKFMGRSSYIYPEPLGIIGIISPWNFPFGIPFSQTVQAISVGNAVILKPSSDTVLTGLKIQELYENVGFPDGIIQVIPGSGSSIGAALVKSNVNRIIFTGSVMVGKKIREMANHNLKPVTLELGGKSPMIVLKDADLKRSVKGAIWGSFVNSGQMCAGVKRIYVQEDIFRDFLDRFVEGTKKLKQGFDWNDPDISMGSMINESALMDMVNHVERAIEQGAKIIIGGSKRKDLKGYFFEPTIISDAKQDHDVVQKEIFGPIVPVLSFKTDDQAISLANDTDFGLYGSVWTNDLENGKKVARSLHHGSVAINNHAYTYGIPQTPWGGNRNSGFGRTHGILGFEELLKQHHVHVDNGRIEEELWWHPYDKNKLDAQKDISDLLFLKKYWKMYSLYKKLKK